MDARRLGFGWCLAAGLALGVLARLGDGAGGGPIVWLVNIGGPWLLLAAALGALGASNAGGAIALLAAVAAKYAVQLLQGAALADLAPRILAWAPAGLLLGALFAAGGRAARRGSSRLALLLPAALALEALALLSGAIDGESAELRFDGQPAAVAVLVGELAVAAGLLVVLAVRLTRRSGGSRPLE